MATGTEAGLLDAPAPQSVFKHALLDQYVIRYAAMTASKLPSKRAVLVDGFAGRGRFDSGAPASAEYMMLAAQKVKATTQIDIFLVEQSRKDFNRLDEVAAEYRARGISIETRYGSCADHLVDAVAWGDGASLFLFLDPCGAILPWTDLQPLLAGRGTWPRTEALLNFNADLIRRAGGQYKAGQLDLGGVATADAVCGGDWWRDLALTTHLASGGRTWESAAEAVALEYARRLGTATSMKPVVAPVRRKAHHQPVYHLIFLTRDPHGHWVFGHAAAVAREKWLEALGPDEELLEEMLFNTVDDQIKQDHQRAVDKITENLLALVGDGRDKVVVDHVGAVFEGVYGEARETAFSQALRALVKAEMVDYAVKGDRPYRHVIRRGAAYPAADSN